MPLPFTLSVPADHRFRAIISDVTAKCAELAGGSPADGHALAEAVARTVSQMHPHAQDQVDLQYRPGRGGVEVTATCGGRTATVHHAIPVSKR